MSCRPAFDKGGKENLELCSSLESTVGSGAKWPRISYVRQAPTMYQHDGTARHATNRSPPPRSELEDKMQWKKQVTFDHRNARRNAKAVAQSEPGFD